MTVVDDLKQLTTLSRNAPTTVAFEILYGCNLHCSYCYVGQQKNHVKTVVPPLSTTRAILAALRDAGVKQVYLIGGEPTLHPLFHEICEAMVALGFAGRGLVTNGTRIDDSLAQLLKKHDFWADVSFRAADPRLFDLIAGNSKAFEFALRASHALTRYQVPFGIEFDCLPTNYLQLLALVESLAAERIRPRHVLLHRIAPSGDAATNPDLQLGIEEYRAVLEQAARIETDYGIPTFFEDGLPLCLIESRYWKHIRACDCGDDLLTIDPEGDVRRCACEAVSLGNVLERGLSPLWHDELACFRSGSFQPTECQECLLFARCKGGCGASAQPHVGYSPDRFSKSFRPFRSMSADTAAHAAAVPALYPLGE